MRVGMGISRADFIIRDLRGETHNKAATWHGAMSCMGSGCVARLGTGFPVASTHTHYGSQFSLDHKNNPLLDVERLGAWSKERVSGCFDPCAAGNAAWEKALFATKPPRTRNTR